MNDDSLISRAHRLRTALKEELEHQYPGTTHDLTVPLVELEEGLVEAIRGLGTYIDAAEERRRGW